jgi:hypothetical protein
MRNLILAFIGFLFLTMASGCGVVRTIAVDTCTQGSYNRIVCPGVLEEALDETPVKTPKAAPTKAVCHSASAFMVKSRHTTKVLSRSNGQCKEVRKLLQDRVRQIGPGVKCRWAKGQIKCAGFNPLASLLFLIALLTSRRSKREEWWGFEALGHVDARRMVWAIEDELYKARWIERAIEIGITLISFSVGGLILGVASTFLAHKRFGWASIFSLFLSVLFWGSALEWALFTVKAVMCFFSNTEEGFHFIKWTLHYRWRRQVAKL